jgi:Protein of unknown function (DUF2799)
MRKQLLISAPALIAMAFTLTSCASYWTRKDCEKTNWFQYGQSVAMQGRRLTGDPKINSCLKAEAEIDEVALDRGFKTGMATYCQPETVFQMGKKGDFFNVEMCDGEQPRFLQKRHAEGVQAYCAKTNGYAAGSKGSKYNGICPKNLEAAFLPEFNRGRKAFLTSAITNNETRIDEIERQIRRLDSDRMSLVTQMALMGNSTSTVVREVKYDPVTHARREETRVEENPEAKRRRDDLKFNLDSKEREIEAKRNEQDKLSDMNREMRTELSTL